MPKVDQSGPNVQHFIRYFRVKCPAGPGDSPDFGGEGRGPPKEGGGHLQGEQDEHGQADGSVAVFQVGILDPAHGCRHRRSGYPCRVAEHLRTASLRVPGLGFERHPPVRFSWPPPLLRPPPPRSRAPAHKPGFEGPLLIHVPCTTPAIQPSASFLCTKGAGSMQYMGFFTSNSLEKLS